MRLRHILLGSVVLLLGCFGCASLQEYPIVPTELSLDYDIAQMMHRIQEEYEKETVFCLDGYVNRTTLYIIGVHPARLNARNSGSVNFDKCTSPNTVGHYHNHPPQLSDDGTVVYYCMLSEPDIHTLNSHTNVWVSLITCDNEETLVWRFKHAKADEFWPPIPPSSDQETGDS